MNEKLVSADEVLTILRSTMCEMACKDDMITAVINLPSRHEHEQEDGLREAVIAKCEALIKECKDGNSTFDSGATRAAQSVLWEVLNFKSVTPKDDKAEALAELAAKKGYWLVISCMGGTYITIKDFDHIKENVNISDPTYPAAEQVARKFLEGLPDKEVE